MHAALATAYPRGPSNLWCLWAQDRIGPLQPTCRNQIQKAHCHGGRGIKCLARWDRDRWTGPRVSPRYFAGNVFFGTHACARTAQPPGGRYRKSVASRGRVPHGVSLADFFSSAGFLDSPRRGTSESNSDPSQWLGVLLAPSPRRSAGSLFFFRASRTPPNSEKLSRNSGWGGWVGASTEMTRSSRRHRDQCTSP